MPSASVTAGSTRCARPPRPETGSQPSWIEKTRMSSGPSQKLGTQTPTRLAQPRERDRRAIAARSAAATPSGSADADREHERGRRASSSVAG